MVAKVNFTIRDHSLEGSIAGIFINSLANAVAMQTRVDAVTEGVIAQRTEISDIVNVSAAQPASQTAQRELGLRIYFSDNVTEKTGTVTIGAPDLAALTLVGDSVQLDDGVGGPMTLLVTELETNGRSADNNAITVNSARIVGRNN